MLKAVPTGVPGLDEILGGGFPKNKLILLAGGPGAGKTIMAAQFLYSGATKYGEKGVYVSFAETAESFKEEMKILGMDFDELEKKGLVKVIDLITTVKPALDANLTTIVENVETLKAERLVIDSFAAMTNAVREKIEVRVIAHLLQKFLLRLGCTTILITEIPWSRTVIGTGVEEFISDGVIMIEPIIERGELKRRLLVLKMRGVSTSRQYHEVSIDSHGVTLIPTTL
ncbi:MAG TPA: ATPase domain-containing protein [archaeon]|nr:ATPase domain-containing protein [archaeon]